MFDLLAVAPFYLLSNPQFRVLLLFRLSRLFKLTFPRFAFPGLPISCRTRLVIRLLYIVALLCHYAACLWCALALTLSSVPVVAYTCGYVRGS